jgi:hypothetical protein
LLRAWLAQVKEALRNDTRTETARPSNDDAWFLLARVLLTSNEFQYVD